MANTILALPPSEIISRAATELAERYGGEAPKVKAINKAHMHLLSELPITPTARGFLIPSGTRSNVIHCYSSVHGCDCEAGSNGRYCWHTAAIELLEIAGKYTMPRLVRKPSPAYAQALAEINELF